MHSHVFVLKISITDPREDLDDAALLIQKILRTLSSICMMNVWYAICVMMYHLRCV